jgi:hypothetical protein
MKIPALVRNVMTSRESWLRKWLDPRRDIDAECGHPADISIEDYKKAYTRGDVAARVVSAYPEETWSTEPEVFETEDISETVFEKAWKELNARLNVFAYLERIDVLSGIGRYGILLLGLDDGAALSQEIGPASGVQRNLLYLRPLDESLVNIESLDNNLTSPRFGRPLEYSIDFVDSENTVLATSGNITAQKVHWSRVIHVADNRVNSEILGAPRMERVINRLLDLKKISGGSGEMFWKGGFPGLSLESHPTGDEAVEFDADATKEQMEAYMNGLQRYLATVGMTARSLSVQVADPRPHIEMQLKLIATAIGIPWRILIGSEAAQLASEQDIRLWNQRLNRRRQQYVTPFIIKPFVDQLILLGVLPEPPGGYQVHWTDLNSPSDQDQAIVAEKKTNALAKYAQSGADALIPPFHYLTLILGMSEEEANAIVNEAGDRVGELGPPDPTPLAIPAKVGG